MHLDLTSFLPDLALAVLGAAIPTRARAAPPSTVSDEATLPRYRRA